MLLCARCTGGLLTGTIGLQVPQPWQPRMERGVGSSSMAALVLTLGEGVERFRLTPEGARGFTVEGMRAIWKVHFVGWYSHRAANTRQHS